MITTRTSDRLSSIANQLQAIATAVYQAGYRDECKELELAAFRTAAAANSMAEKIEAGVRAMMTDIVDERPGIND